MGGRNLVLRDIKVRLFSTAGGKGHGMRRAGMRRGGTTVFLCILLSALVPMGCVLTDLARWQLAQVRVRDTVALAAESLLAGYDRPLREQYALFGLADARPDVLAARAESLLCANLEADPLADGDQPPVADLFGLTVAGVRVETGDALARAEVLGPYAADCMRYRAPVQLAAGFVEKLAAFRGAMAETEVIRTDMALERARALLREDLVRLRLLMTMRMPALGTDPGTAGGTLADRIDAVVDTQAESVRLAATRYNAAVPALDALLPQLSACRVRLELAQAAAHAAETEALRARKALADAVGGQSAGATRDDAGQAQASGGHGQTDAAHAAGADIAAAAGGGGEGVSDAKAVSALRAEVVVREAAAGVALREAESCRQTWEALLRTQWEPAAASCGASLETVCAGLAEIMRAEGELAAHLERYGRTLAKAGTLAQGLVSGLERIGPQTAAAAAGARKSGTLSQGYAEADAARVPSFPDAVVMERVREGAEAGERLLEGWSDVVAQQMAQTRNLLRDAESAAANFRTVAAEPGRDSSLPLPALDPQLSRDPVPGTDLSSLAGFADYGRMRQAGTIAIPDFEPGQPASGQEISEYRTWLSTWTGEHGQTEGEEDAAVEDDRTTSTGQTLRSIRDAASRTARLVRGEESDTGDAGNLRAIPQHLLDTLPSCLASQARAPHPLADTGTGTTSIRERRENSYTASLDRFARAGGRLAELSDLSGRSFVERLWEDAYILSAFKHAGMPEGGIVRDLSWGRDLSGTVFDKGEVEYVLFGCETEAGNRTAMKGTLFGVRLGMNLCHVYASSPKRSATLALAGALAGWTGFGLPVVQHFLMIAWAAAESCVDVERLLRGEKVPLVKTEASWFLSAGSLRGTLVQQLVLDPLKGHVAGACGEAIGNADQAVRETVGGWTDAAVESVFAPLEAQCEDFGRQLGDGVLLATEGMPETIESGIADLLGRLPADGEADQLTGRFGEVLHAWVETFRRTCSEAVVGLAVEQVSSLREQVKAEVRRQVFGSRCYASLVETARSTAMGLADAGFDRLEQKADSLLGRDTASNPLKSGITGRMATLSYEEYLALFLLCMPQQTKTERVADLIQLNLGSALGTTQYRLAERATCVRLDVSVEMDFWFIPRQVAERAGLTTIRSEAVCRY